MEDLFALIHRYYAMMDGEHIENHQSFFVVHDDEMGVMLKYKTVKHIVEKRKKDGYGIDELKALFEGMYDLINSSKYNVIKDIKNNSYLLIQRDYRFKSLVVVIDMNLEDEAVCVKTAFLRSATQIDKLKK
jgi:hypothetical protein